MNSVTHQWQPPPAARAPLLPRDDTPPPAALARWLGQAGVRFNGDRPWDIQVHDARLYRRLLARGSLGAGEAYVDGDWDCEQLDALFNRVLRAGLDRHALGRARWLLWQDTARHALLNLQSPQRARQVAEAHYDVGNDVFEAMLDSRMSYSCGWWQRAHTLEQAQADKLELICQKLQLRPGLHLLDIGCGWGGLARHAALHHGVRVTGVTVSREQLALGRERCAGLPVELRLQDYRELDGQFDRIASVGMFEHVGPKNHGVFMDVARRLLARDGLFLLHTIGLQGAAMATDPWIERHVFPNGKIPSAVELSTALQGRFVIEDWHSFASDYDRTLMSWWRNFEQAWPSLQARCGERFHRSWRYYLLCCAGFFRSRQGQLWQLVLSHAERDAVYRSVRSEALVH
jgi:cyclopropane-fatty-acyl-phospholipid synthase